LSLEAAAARVRRVFGGREVVESTYRRRVADTRYGEFVIEIDSTFLKQKQYEKPLRGLGIDFGRIGLESVERLLMGGAGNVVPFAVATPPIPFDEIGPLEELRRLLRAHDAEGTRVSLLYAFGFHINPEAPAIDPPTLLSYLRAFLLLYPWLRGQVQVDITRRLRPYVNPFPEEYAKLVLAADYSPLAKQLIDDYLRFNPSRNRPLDMLPVLACLDERHMHSILSRTEDAYLVKPRPAFHYRMPNCLIDEPDWSVAAEWNRWVAVERLAGDPRRVARLAADYLAGGGKGYNPFPAADDSPAGG
jgi:hypothetical protein